MGAQYTHDECINVYLICSVMCISAYTLQFSDSLLLSCIFQCVGPCQCLYTISPAVGGVGREILKYYHSTLQILRAHVSVCIWCNGGVGPDGSPIYPPQTQGGIDEFINVYLICSVIACTHTTV